jgi:hypothetical protein
MAIKLSEDLKKARVDRPDEWTMDRFIAAAEKLEGEKNLAVEVFTETLSVLRDFYCAAEISDTGEVIIPLRDDDNEETRFFKKINELEGRILRATAELLDIF